MHTHTHTHTRWVSIFNEDIPFNDFDTVQTVYLSSNPKAVFQNITV